MRSTVLTLGLADPLAVALMAKYPKPAAPTTQATGIAPAAIQTEATPTAAAVQTGFGGAGPALTSNAPVLTGVLSLKDQLAARLRAGQANAAAPK